MGKGAGKRKKRTPLFSESDLEISKTGFSDDLELRVGTMVEIAGPSNGYYAHVYKTLDFQRLEMIDMSQLADLKGTEARVSSIVNMVGGESIAIVNRIDGLPFFEEHFRVYVDKTKAIDSGELKIITNKNLN